MTTDLIRTQLQEGCKITTANWAARLELGPTGWRLNQAFGLSQSGRNFVAAMITGASFAAWLAGGLKTGRIRSRKLVDAHASLLSSRVFIVPNPASQTAVLIGCDQLNSTARSVFRIIANGFVSAPPISPDWEQIIAKTLNEITAEITYDLPSVLRRILGALDHILPTDAAVIGLRYGSQLQLQAGHGILIEAGLHQIELADIPALNNLLAGKKERIIQPLTAQEQCPLFPEFEVGFWVGLPLIIGTRSIGAICFFAADKAIFTPERLKSAELIIAHLAPSIEKAVAFDEMSHYLEKLAILNEMAATVAISNDPREVAERIMRRLRKIFKTELVSLLMVHPNGETLYEFGNHQSTNQQLEIPIDQSLTGFVVDTGQPARLADVQTAPRYYAQNPGVVSELAVPLKYRERVIGVMNLESPQPDAFSERDEQLLVVIASHLAGFVENVRLNDETRRRVKNLARLHHITEQIVGLEDIAIIAQVAADTIADQFEYEIVTVNLADADGKNLAVTGVGGIGATKIRLGFQNAANLGITGKVYQTGQSRLAKDTTQDPDYIDFAGWQAGSELCVPLRSGEQVIGVIDVERVTKNAISKNDQLLLEAVAGLVSSVMTSAMRFQELQVNYRHLQAARETAIDISTELDLNTVLHRAAHRARELVGAKGVELGFVNPDKEVVEVKVSENPWGDLIRGAQIPFGAGVAGVMAVEGKSIRVGNYSSWEHQLTFSGSPPFSSVAGVPLIYQGAIIGTLTVSNDEIGIHFSSEDLLLLELLAPQIAASVNNAKLYQELQESVKAERLASERLIQSARLAAVGEMAAGVAHELNNPLTTITGFVELAMEEIPADSLLKADLALVLRESNRAKEVVRRLLDFSRPGEGFRVRSDINDMVSEVIAIIQHLARTTGVDLRMELWNDLPWLQVDRHQIKQVILNLFQNALQAMPNGGVLKIQTAMQSREQRDWVTVKVEDTGEGILPDILPRIFEPFFTTRPPGKGAGLGLAVSYGIIQDHGGMIAVESTPNHGSEFTIWLPVKSNRMMI